MLTTACTSRAAGPLHSRPCLEIFALREKSHISEIVRFTHGEINAFALMKSSGKALR